VPYKRDQPHGNYEVHNDRMDGVHPREVVIVERRQQLKHGAQTNNDDLHVAEPPQGTSKAVMICYMNVRIA
jgi:hypothetical protein